MYASFYKLNENPFNLTPDPKFHYVNDSTREAMAALLYGIESRKGFVTLVGDAGTGKTTLLRRVFETIEADTRVVFVFNPGVSFDELLEFICIELGIRTDSYRRLHLLERLNQYLLDQLTAGYNVVVMIDEAQTLDDKVLEELRLLTNLETSKEKILQIVLSGQPELEDKLRQPSMRQLRQRIGARSKLQPMRQSEIGPYIETRLRSAGSEEGQLFTAPALRKIWLASNGIPRVVNVICDNAMVIGFAKGEHRISTATVKEAIGDLAGDDLGGGEVDLVRLWLGRPAVRYVGAAVAALAIAVPFALSLLFNRAEPRRSTSADFRGSAAVRPVAEAVPAALEGEAQPAAQPTQAASPAGADPVTPRIVAAAEPDPLPVVIPAAVEDAVDVEPATPSAAEASLPPVAEPTLAPPVVATAAQREAVVDTVPAPSLEAAPRPTSVVDDTMRRAELMARSTAARLYDGEARRREELESRADSARPAAAAAKPKPVVAPQPKRTKVEAPRVAATAPAPQTPKQPTVAREAPKVEEKKPAPKAEPATAASRVAPAASGDEPVRTASIAREKSAREVRERRGPIVGLGSGQPPVGRLVRVQGGDTISRIATRHYRDAGPATVEALMARSPGLKSAGKLREGELVLLPFLTAQEMVKPSTDGSYRVLITQAPSSSQTDAAKGWLEESVPKLRLYSESPRRNGEAYTLYAVGFISRNDALAAADYVLFKLAELQAGRPSRRATEANRSRLVSAPPSGPR